MDRSKWEYKKLEVDNLPIGDVFDIFMGRTPSRDDLSFWEDGNHEWVSIGDMGAAKYISETKEKVSDIACANMRLVPKDTVIMSFKLSIGKVAITAIPLYTNEAIMAFPPKPGYNISPNYLYYHLQAYKWQSTNRAVMGKTLNKAVISSSRITIPDLETQQRIVAELDCLNEMIALKQDQLKEFDKLAQSIFYDMFGDPVTNEKGWAIKKLEQVCQKITDGTHNSPVNTMEGEYMYVTAKNIKKDGIIVDDITYVSAEVHMVIYARCNPQYGDVLYIKDGVTTGIATINTIKEEFSLLSSVALLKPGNNITNYYLKAVLNIPSMYVSIRKNMGGAAITRLTIAKINSIEIPLPPLALQQQFAEKIKAIEVQKELVKKSIAETQQLLDSRMDYYFD